MNELFKNDRNFNDEIIKQRHMFVAEHNDLITKADHDLTANELKVMDLVISKIKPTDDDFYEVDTSLYEIANVFDLKRSGKTYNNIANALRSLRAKEVLIYSKNSRAVTITGWLERAIIEENGQVSIRINEQFAPFLLDLTSDYTQYRLIDTVQLDSKYSIRLYKLMREADKRRGKITPVIKDSPDEIADMLSAPESYNWSRLKQNVLDRAINEINLKIEDMELELYTQKRGRRVVEVEIHNTFYPRKSNLHDDDFEPVPMINWIKDINK